MVMQDAHMRMLFSFWGFLQRKQLCMAGLSVLLAGLVLRGILGFEPSALRG